MPPQAANSEEQEYGVWRASGRLPAIEYSLTVLEELRQAGDEGYQKVRHGGIEVGAVLFGRRDGDVVRIEEWRPIPCRHARGPSFALTDEDLKDLERLLAECAGSPLLAGLEPVGWFHTHTRSGIHLTEEDLAIHNRFFAEPWQVAFVMRFAKDEPCSGGFFLRETGGSVIPDASPLEFVVRTNPGVLLRARRPSALALNAAEPAPRPRRLVPPPAVPSVDPVPARPRGSYTSTDRIGFSAGEPAPTAPAAASRQQWRLDAPGGNISASHPADLRSYRASLPGANPRKLPWRLIIGGLTLLLLGAIALLSRPYWPAAPQPTIALEVSDAGNQLVVLWDHNAPQVRDADRGRLVAIDGGLRTEIPLTAEDVHLGSVTVARHSGDVEIQLVLWRSEDQLAEESTRFVGGAPASGAPATVPARAAAAAAAASSVQAALDAQKARQAQLRESIRALEERLKQEDAQAKGKK